LSEQPNLSYVPKKLKEAERIESSGRSITVLALVCITVDMALSLFTDTPAWAIWTIAIGSVFLMAIGFYQIYFGSTQLTKLHEQTKNTSTSGMKKIAAAPIQQSFDAEKKFCRYCGKGNKGDAVYCEYCGKTF